MICPLRSRAPHRAVGGDKAKKLLSHEPNPMLKRETLELVRAYYEISDPQVREELFAMVTTLAAASSGRAKP